MPSLNNHKRNNENKPSVDGYPDLNWHSEKILIIAKTAPLPSVTHRELVCTAGVTQNGKLIRLYPIPFRYMNYSKRYKEYQRIEVEIRKHQKDKRIDSYEPNIDTLRPLGKPLPTGKATERKKIILPLVSQSLEELKNKFKKQKISLGIFKPKKGIKLSIKKENGNWSAKHQQVLKQKRLFGTQPKTLKKIPFKFSYDFFCNDPRCKKGHSLKIINWGLSELYRGMKEKYPYSLDIVLEKIKQKYEKEMWNKERDSYLIVGTVYPYASFVVIGVFWPPK